MASKIGDQTMQPLLVRRPTGPIQSTPRKLDPMTATTSSQISVINAAPAIQRRPSGSAKKYFLII